MTNNTKKTVCWVTYIINCKRGKIFLKVCMIFGYIQCQKAKYETQGHKKI